MSHVPPRLRINDEHPEDYFRRLITYAYAIGRMYPKADGGAVEEYAGGGAIKRAFELARGIVPGSFSGHRLPTVDALARNSGKFVYHSGVADDLPNMEKYLEPQHGNWVKEVAAGAVDEDPEQFLDENAVPLLWMSQKPTWVKSKVARKLGVPHRDVTPEQIQQHGHVALVPRKSEDAGNIWWVGQNGLDNGPYSSVTNLRGETREAYQTDLYDHPREPFGVERNEYVSAHPVEPMLHLTGDSLVDFLRKTGNIKADGGAVKEPEGFAGGGGLKKAIDLAKGIIAYHGSPHAFDKFDISKIGTGEGAQAYGHGLYFADNEAVAKAYRDNLASPTLKTPSGELFDPQTQLKHLNVRAAARNNGPDLDATIARAQQLLPKGNEQTRPLLQQDLETLLRLKEAGGIAPNPGSMYQVLLHADPEHFLDWDRPFASADDVERFAAKFDSVNPTLRNKIEDWGYERQQRGQRMPDGSDLVREVFGGIEGPSARQGQRDMLAAGIPGIKYLDAGSRGAGEGSRNYVMFDDKPIEILRRYAQGGLIQDEHPSHYMPGVGRQVMQDGGGVDDIDAAMEAARRVSDEQAMSHPVGMSGKVEFAPLEIEEPLTGYKATLGSVPKETAAVANPALQTASEIAPYFTPAAPIAAARDVAVGLRSGDPASMMLAATGVPGKAAKAALMGGSLLMPSEAEAGPLGKALDYARRLTDRGFYSPAAEALASVKQEKGKVGDFLNAIKGKPGVTADELRHAGVESAFAPDATVTRDEIADFLHNRLPQIQETIYGGAPITHHPREVDLEDIYGDDVPSYLSAQYDVGPHTRPYIIQEADKRGPAEYYLQGLKGDNLGDYRTLDEAVQAANDAIIGRDPAKYAEHALPGGGNYRELVMHLPPAGAGSNRGFESNHWTEPNVLAHLRMSDRVDPTGKKALHLDEIQSDWGQAARDKGVSDLSAVHAAEQRLSDLDAASRAKAKELTERGERDVFRHPEYKAITDQHESAAEALWAAKRAATGVTPGPYIASTEGWTDLALKRALREAAEGGYDKMVWTPGAAQADRYDLSKQVGEVAYSPQSKRLIARTHGGNDIGPQEPVEPGDLAKHIGKDAAKRLLEQEPNNLGIHSLRGDDLKVGGHGMLDYYDKLVPSRLQKLIKKLGHSPLIEMASHELPSANGDGSIMGHALHMTPELREAIMKGLPAFEQGGRVGYDDGGGIVDRVLAAIRGFKVPEPVLPLPDRLPAKDDFVETAKSVITPPDAYGAAGQAVQQYRSGHPIDAFETLYGSMPMTGTVLGGKALDPAAVRLAENMKKAGATERSIFDRTKLWEGPTVQNIDPAAPGPWRSEGVSDHDMMFKSDPMESKGSVVPLPSLVKHDELFDKVPSVADFSVAVHPESNGSAYFSGPGVFKDLPKGGIVLGNALKHYDQKEVLGILAHELQHAVQYALNLPQGGGASLISGLRPEIEQNAKTYAGTTLGKLYNDLRLGAAQKPISDTLAEMKYRRLGGEEEAYATGHRVPLTQAGRDMLPMFEGIGLSNRSYSNPIKHQIAVPQGFWQDLIEQRLGGKMPVSDDLF